MAGYLSEDEAKRYFSSLARLSDFSDQFPYDSESDRAVAIVGPAQLDAMLHDILSSFFIADTKEVEKLLQPNGALGAFGNRITACYVLGLTNDVVTRDLRLVAKIRNRFAHEVSVGFEDSKIKDWVRELRWHHEAIMRAPPPDATTRDVFQVGVHTLVSHLSGLIGIARYSKREPAKWE